MLQAQTHRHADLIWLSDCNNACMDSMDEHRAAMGQRIAELREEAGLKQPGLAELAGIKQSSLWEIENGRTKEITARTLIGLCRALGTTWEYLWEGAGEVHTGKEEAELVAIYRQLPPDSKRAAMHSVRTLLAAVPASPQPRFSMVKPPPSNGIEHPPEYAPRPVTKRTPVQRKRRS